MSKISIQDISKKLNISITTVSLVLNGKADQYKISKQTQKKINDYVSKINYIPNAHARGLSSGKSYIIGYIVPDIANPFFAHIGRTIEDILAKEGYQLMISSFDEDPIKESKIINKLLSRQVDGLIVASSGKANESLNQVLESKIPLVLFDREIKNIKADYIGINNKESAYSAISQLIKNGSKKIAMITLTPDVITINERINGYYQALNEAGIEIDKSMIINADFKDLKTSIYENLNSVFNLHTDLDAIFFINNLCALNGLVVMNTYFKDKLKDFFLLSFDDIEFFEFTNPPISGIAQPRTSIAENCSNILLSKIRDPKEKPKKILLKSQINWR